MWQRLKSRVPDSEKKKNVTVTIFDPVKPGRGTFAFSATCCMARARPLCVLVELPKLTFSDRIKNMI